MTELAAHHYHDDGGIYYFGYGALVNPTSRQRRGITTCQAQAASLPDFRLTFAVGGAANVVKQRGYEVHGVLMRCASPKDFQILSDFDTGYDCIQVNVVPYNDYWSEEAEDDEEGHTKGGYRNSLRGKQPIKANMFVMHSNDDDNCDLPKDKLPQERYLRVIASGMQSYGVVDGYIEEEIMGVSYIPSRKPGDYLRFATVPTVAKMPLLEWNRTYDQRMKKAEQEKTNLLLFRIGNSVIQVDENSEPDNPLFVWARGRLAGTQDSTWVIVQTLFDPDLPRIDSPEEVAKVHQDWAENQMVDILEQGGIAAFTIIQIQAQMQGVTDRLASLDATSCSGLASSLPSTQTSKADNAIVKREGKSRSGRSKSLRTSLLSGFRGVFSFKKTETSQDHSGSTATNATVIGSFRSAASSN